MKQEFTFFKQTDLVHRLSHALKKRGQEVIFVVGSALSAPMHPGQPGVADSDGVIDLIRKEFSGNPTHLAEFNNALDTTAVRKYQAAFLFLQGRLGQPIANEIVRKAVLGARIGVTSSTAAGTDDECRLLELDGQWALNPGTESLGKLVASYPDRFGKSLLTTNFDPLLEIAIRKAKGQCFRTVLHADGNLSQTDGIGCHVIHLHGYWYGSDTLHTTRQVQQLRPRLKASLAAFLREKLVVVSGYGGWDDVFTQALIDVAREDASSPEVLWSFRSANPQIEELLAERLAPGINRGRVSLYAEVDCNIFFTELYRTWLELEAESSHSKVGPTNSVRIADSLRKELIARDSKVPILEGDDEDRPPVVTLCVGREKELQELRDSDAKVVFLTGIGGEGKSTVAAQYLSESMAAGRYNHFVWRDCKEESERFENQLASVVEKLSGGKISGEDLAKQDAQSIVRLFLAFTADLEGLFVFDNADHYVNLEAERMTASPDLLIQAIVASASRSQILFTCRPSVKYQHPLTLSFHLKGISLEATRALFSEREAICSEEEIQQAYELTNGHAFWLDLLSIQVAKTPAVALGRLVQKIRNGSGTLPEKTLRSIWTTLREREQLVLRSMAETVRPETEGEIASYLESNNLHYNKVIRSINALRSLNLIVVKKRSAESDLLELHPLVRHFIRQSFSKPDRSSFINAILKVYALFRVSHRSTLSERPTLTTLQYWSQTVELDVEAGRISDAFMTLLEAANAFATSAYAREFSRTVRLLLASFDWTADHSKYQYFDDIFRIHVSTLSNLGEKTEVDELLDNYALTVPDKDSRYILFCDMKCNSKWQRDQFGEAVKWGLVGQNLKTTSHVDTRFDVSHNLALAQRDAGRPELALPVFLGGRNLSEVVDPEELDEKKGGDHYGNIGRCLYFMGQYDSALVCYQKSAILIEKNRRTEHFVNQGFIRRWIAEILIARNEYRLAAIFLEAARLKWEQVSPPKALQVVFLRRQIQDKVPQRIEMPSHETERVFLDWISGRFMDAESVKS